jgi:hypothetical protein
MTPYDHLIGRRLVAVDDPSDGTLTLHFEDRESLTVAGDWDVFASEPLLSVTFSTTPADNA